MRTSSGRRAIGAVLIDLVKFLKNLEKTVGLPPTGPHAAALLRERVVSTEWYPLEGLQELLRILDALVLRGDELRSMELGAAGGTAVRGLLKAYVVHGDPKTSVLAMRHGWRAHYDFGRLTGEPSGASSVLFVLSEYPDLPMVQGLIAVGWGVAAARAAGSTRARYEVLERPWKGAPHFKYLVHC